MKVLHFETIDSTNLEARRLAELGETGPLWIVAAEQTAGKGRLGRHWVSKRGNLYSTLLWPTAAPQSTISQLSFLAAIAVAEAASNFSIPNAISLKWPNDCLLNGAKFCGILCEVIRPGLIAIGIGINIAHVPEGLPYKAERLSDATVEALFAELQTSLANQLDIWAAGENFSAIRAAWMKQCPHIGQNINVDGISGTFVGLGEDGALLLQLPNQTINAFYAGDVRVEYQHSYENKT